MNPFAKKIAELVSRYSPDLAFTLFEIGARPLSDEKELFYGLLDVFPKSRILAFEVDEALCDEMNEKTADNIKFYGTGLGLQDGEQTLYETARPMCSSLYKPNVNLLARYNSLEPVMPKSEFQVSVRSLDSFTAEHEIDQIDFIKIDIQGAELDVFQGGMKSLQNTVCVISEVEFIPLYTDQPLFGDVCQQLTKNGLMFHKFSSMHGRTLKNTIVGGNMNVGTQHMWSDAIFITAIDKIDSLSPESLLKLGLLASIYDSPDVTFYCFEQYDKKENTDLLAHLKKLCS